MTSSGLQTALIKFELANNLGYTQGIFITVIIYYCYYLLLLLFITELLLKI